MTVTPMLEHFGEMPEGVQALKMDKMSFKGFPPLRKAKGMADEGTYKDVEVGKGGGYTQFTAASIVVQQIVYVDRTFRNNGRPKVLNGDDRLEDWP